MARISSFPLTSWSLRTRITVWYVLLVGLTLVAFSVFIYFRLQNSLISQLDSSLEVVTSQALADLENDGDILVFGDQSIEFIGSVISFTEDRLTLSDGNSFEINEDTDIIVPPEIGLEVEVDAIVTAEGLIALEVDIFESDGEAEEQAEGFNLADFQRLNDGEFVLRVLGSDWTVWDVLGDQSFIPFPLPEEPTFDTTAAPNGSKWRVQSVALVSSEGEGVGWLQTATSLDSVDDTLGSVRTQLFWGVPLALALAALGGLFVADRGLRPIDRITRIAQDVSGSVLNRRIGYQGRNDEVGRLANTFDAMLDRLENAFERERRFTSDASHELRTPLTSLKGRIDVTLGNPRTKEEYEETLRVLEEEVDRLIRLSSELLFLARLDQGRISRQTEDIDFNNLLGAVLDQMRPLAESKNLTVIEDVPPDTTVRGDPDHLIRLFLNVIDNAYKYTPEGGRITIHVKISHSEVKISVSDTGPGIPDEHKAKLFERFYRVDVARSRDSGGTGLGLSIVNEIVQMHNGRLEVQSEVGKGTTFTIVLPVDR